MMRLGAADWTPEERRLFALGVWSNLATAVIVLGVAWIVHSHFRSR